MKFFNPFLVTDSSFVGLLFSFVEESILNILKVTEDTVNMGLQSVSKISKQTNPFEKTTGFTGILSTKVTEGFFKGYNNKIY